MMNNLFTVASEYRRGDSVALFLNGDIPLSTKLKMKFLSDGKLYEFGLTHDKRAITVRSSDSFLGKKIEIL